MRSLCVCSAALVLLGLAPARRAGTPQDPNFTESVFASGAGLDDATGLAWATDGSDTLFVSQKAGSLRVVRGGALQSANFATLNPVYTNNECGLDDVAVDPSYASNHYVYVFVTESGSLQRIYRYTAAASGSDLVGTGKTQIGPDLPTAGQNHNGSGMAVGPDGYLYWGVGNLGNGSGPLSSGTGIDGGPDEFTSFASKICRMNRFTGDAVPGGPFSSGGGNTVRNYMFAKGARNPFGLRFHPSQGTLWLTAVGDGYEQIFLVPSGGDIGWPAENNTSATNGLLVPKFDYQTNSSPYGGCITRGVFYNGTQYPAAYRGDFYFVDYNSGQVMRAHMNAAGDAITSVDIFVTGVGGVVDLSVGPDGALYYVTRGSANVYRLGYTGPSQNIIVSTSSLAFAEGAGGTFGVHLALQPAGDVTVSVARWIGDAQLSASPAQLTFTTSNWGTDQTVIVNSVASPDGVNENATIRCSSTGLAPQDVEVTANDTAVAGAPGSKIFAPLNGQTVSGTSADFYGYGYPVSPATLAKAEFYIDGKLGYTDPWDPAVGHFHWNDGHAQWDTTTLFNGPHTLRMTVYDNGTLKSSDQIVVTVNNPGGAAPPGGSGGGGSCGLAGLESVATVALAAGLRRRRRRYAVS